MQSVGLRADLLWTPAACGPNTPVRFASGGNRSRRSRRPASEQWVPRWPFSDASSRTQLLRAELWGSSVAGAPLVAEDVGWTLCASPCQCAWWRTGQESCSTNSRGMMSCAEKWNSLPQAKYAQLRAWSVKLGIACFTVMLLYRSLFRGPWGAFDSNAVLRADRYTGRLQPCRHVLVRDIEAFARQ